MDTQAEETITPPDVIPGELWMLWNGRSFVLSIDDATDGPTYLACFSEAEAKSAAGHQREMYYIDCIPVRVK